MTSGLTPEMPFAKEVEYTRSCAYAPQPQCPAMRRPMCPCAVQQPCVCNQPVCTCPQVSCPCAPAKPKVEEFVDVKTQTTTIEKKIITTTRVETPAPVCQQVCRPVCPKKKTVTTTVTTVEEESCPMQCSQKCEQPKCKKICTETCEEGRKNCSTECVEDCNTKTVIEEPVKVVEKVVRVPAPVVEETGGVEVEKRFHRIAS